MEGTSIAIEIDGEAICLDNVGDNEQEAQEDGDMQQIIYSAENGEQVAFHTQEQGREEDPAGNEEDREHNSIIPSREELTEELRNKVAYSEEEAYRLYCDYGHRMGFSVRKGKQYYFTGTKTIRTKDYYCSKEGLKDDEQLTEANFNKPETRTNCKAMVRFRVDSEGQWRVIQIIPEHNHELVRPEEIHLLRSVRTLSVPKPGVLNAMVNAEIQAMHDSLHINEDGTECHSQLSIRSYTLLEPEDSFHSILSKCMRECESEAEFDEAWAMMHQEYNMQEHQWLSDLYQQRHKWCTALHKDAFDGGIESLDRSEGSNNVLSSISDESTSLITFVLELDKTVGSWRKNESLEDIQCKRAAPECAVKHSSILQHAAEEYTHKVYKALETDFLEGCGATSYQEVQCDETLYRAMWFVYDLLMKSKSHHNTRKLILDVLESGEKSLESVCELKKLHMHPLGKEKDGRNVKQVVLPQPADSVFVDPPNQDQYYAAEDIASNSSIGRPFFYQGYPATGVSTSQIQGHTNMQSVPQCASQVLQ
ncbi:hypothetical protein BAE44_0002549 [Dichanthelium oligosanthes]|uniref:FAR1 domain-containing protein n=1 Tax=Dichanthelium oligosanthes TaxID=888268 RepID=A0A1E5WH11_9POAL|nr:hypothetical protein BAE44_0002549 [Dichanthelium oligosanthes]